MGVILLGVFAGRISVLFVGRLLGVGRGIGGWRVGVLGLGGGGMRGRFLIHLGGTGMGMRMGGFFWGVRRGWWARKKG